MKSDFKVRGSPMEINKLETPSKLEIIGTARAYSLNPRLIKARAFAYFEAGFSPSETSLLIKTNVKPRSIQAYFSEWKELSQFQEETPGRDHPTAREAAGVLESTSDHPTGEEPPKMSNSDLVTRGDLRIAELERENADLKAKAQGHPTLKTTLAHVAGCPSCRSELDEYNRGIIIKAIDGLSVEAIRDLGFEKGAFPQKFTIPG